MSEIKLWLGLRFCVQRSLYKGLMIQHLQYPSTQSYRWDINFSPMLIPSSLRPTEKSLERTGAEIKKKIYQNTPRFLLLCACVFSGVWLFATQRRLVCLWDFPGKNTGVGYHALLQGNCQHTDWNHISCMSGRFFTTEPPGKLLPLLIL